MQYDLLQLVISFPPIHALGDLSQAPPRFEPGSPAWEADDLPTELSLPPVAMLVSLNWWDKVINCDYTAWKWCLSLIGISNLVAILVWLN